MRSPRNRTRQRVNAEKRGGEVQAEAMPFDCLKPQPLSVWRPCWSQRLFSVRSCSDPY